MPDLSENRSPQRSAPWLCTAALLCATAATAGCAQATGADYLKQNWSAEVRKEWWYTPQGSRIIPHDWFLALEQASGETLLSSEEGLAHLRFIPGAKDPEWNPDGLPIGFTVDVDESTGERFFGVTCAACHTGQITYQGKRVIVDGAPARGDFDRLISEIVEAMQATLADPGKLARFAGRALGAGHDPAAAEDLEEEMARVSDELAARVERNRPPHPNGYGRLDAFGNIFNEVAVTAIDEPRNRQLANAPVGFPVLWDTPQHDAVQWDGSALNAGIGPYVRNAGEVVGVFGDVRIEKPADGGPLRYSHHVDFGSLKRLEEILVTLWSPRWPEEVLPAIDTDLIGEGERLYRGNCLGCHAIIERTDLARDVKAKIVALADIGTDPAMARNRSSRVSMTGLLEGAAVLPVPRSPKFPAQAKSVTLVVNAVFGVMAKDLPRVIGPAAFKAGLGAFLQARNERDASGAFPVGYKARPLNGVWASAPYLHNESVASLWELLQKPAARMTRFHAGSWEFDPKRVGFVTTEGRHTSAFLTHLEGNRNDGHDYGTDLSDDQKWQLIEFLKTL